MILLGRMRELVKIVCTQPRVEGEVLGDKADCFVGTNDILYLRIFLTMVARNGSESFESAGSEKARAQSCNSGIFGLNIRKLKGLLVWQSAMGRLSAF